MTGLAAEMEDTVDHMREALGYIADAFKRAPRMLSLAEASGLPGEREAATKLRNALEALRAAGFRDL